MVKTVPAPKTKAESDQETEDRNEKTANNRHTFLSSLAVVLVGLLQFGVYAYQAKKLRETVEAAGEQSKAMERYIFEAERSCYRYDEVG